MPASSYAQHQRFAPNFAPNFAPGFGPGFGQDMATRLARMRRVAWLVDAAFHIPGTRIRFGLNSLIGLAPGAGDAVLGLVSLYIVQQAHAMGVPPAKLARMVANVAIEVVGGSVPVLGDLFDVALKANLRNIRIVEDHFGVPSR